jgi:hypothetical protein
VTDFHHSVWLRARKEHKCAVPIVSREKYRYRTCIIKPGDRYEQTSGVFDGNLYSDRLCRLHAAECAAYFDMRLDRHRDHGLSEGINLYELREDWNEEIGGDPVLWRVALRAIRNRFRESK